MRAQAWACRRSADQTSFAIRRTCSPETATPWRGSACALRPRRARDDRAVARVPYVFLHSEEIERDGELVDTVANTEAEIEVAGEGLDEVNPAYVRESVGHSAV